MKAMSGTCLIPRRSSPSHEFNSTQVSILQDCQKMNSRDGSIRFFLFGILTITVNAISNQAARYR